MHFWFNRRISQLMHTAMSSDSAANTEIIFLLTFIAWKYGSLPFVYRRFINVLWQIVSEDPPLLYHDAR